VTRKVVEWVIEDIESDVKNGLLKWYKGILKATHGQDGERNHEHCCGVARPDSTMSTAVLRAALALRMKTSSAKYSPSEINLRTTPS
jgi:hypothetical protein